MDERSPNLGASVTAARALASASYTSRMSASSCSATASTIQLAGACASKQLDNASTAEARASFTCTLTLDEVSAFKNVSSNLEAEPTTTSSSRERQPQNSAEKPTHQLITNRALALALRHSIKQLDELSACRFSTATRSQA